VLLCIDELVDAGKILEIDPSAIANRVLMRGADARGPQNPDITIQQVEVDVCGARGGVLLVCRFSFSPIACSGYACTMRYFTLTVHVLGKTAWGFVEVPACSV